MKQQQHALFDAEPDPWRLDDDPIVVADVVFAAGPTGTYTYRVPERLLKSAEPGRRVRAPFGRGNRLVTGYCVEVAARAIDRRRLKDISGVVDDQALLSPAMLRLTRWIAEHYLCEWGQALEAVLPAGVRGKAGTRVATFLEISEQGRTALATEKLPKKQKQALAVLADEARALAPNELASLAGCTLAPIAALRSRHYIRTVHKRVKTGELRKRPTEKPEKLHLNVDQQAAFDLIVESIHGRRYEVILLHGVTGSGKTEVYIRAIEEAVAFGRTAIVLVPEISLTPQTVARFRTRFPGVAVLHSHQTDAERHWHWEEIAAGRVQVVVGPRSAIFAPIPHLGLIVLDEEHESSFKQETTPRYHARDVALRRAADENIPLVLGSATPSLESWHRAREGEYRLVEMPRRVFDRPMPDVVTIDMLSAQQGRPRRSALSAPLTKAMEQALDTGGQVILLLNRRGFATHIQCPSCALVVRCPRCDIALIHHRQQEIALCHYCDYQIPPPTECPECRFAGIAYGGIGTERLEAEVRARFANYSCLRMDTDAMRGPGAHERALDKFRHGEVQILLGTQMIAKGLDFPNVTLVGVVNADIALHLPDFRASERTFQILSQVAGRTGRGEKGGRVLVQTLNPHHPSIEAAARHDFQGFATVELEGRRALGYPPFGELIRVIVRGEQQSQVESFAEHLVSELTGALSGEAPPWRVLGPALAPIAKLRGEYRYHLQLQGHDGDVLRRAVQQVTAAAQPPEGILWAVDVDPTSML
jgi:primosomal protein N' (replication factor Y)